MITTFVTATSLDGFIADQDHRLDWLLSLKNEEEVAFEEFLGTVGAIAMGANTYRWILDNHVMPPDGTPNAWPYNAPTFVFCHRPQLVPSGAEIRFVSGDVGEVHRDMVAAAGDRVRWIVGGGDLAAQFYDADCLDEVKLHVASVTLGTGISVFPRRLETPWQLMSARAVGDTFAELTYRIGKRDE